MDFHLKQWRNQQEHESEEQHSTKIPKLFLPESHHHHHQQHQPALPFFVPEPNSKVSTLSDSTMLATTNNRFPRGMGSHFSLSQWQELELQALIFRYMLAGATVPSELLQPIKKSLLHSPPFFLHHHPLHLQPPPPPAAFLQSGYWGRAAMDPEPGRCRRTDGKKWRCSRDVVAGQKYCERHMHRGRNRSRKPVELPTPTTAGGGGGSFCALSSISSPPPLATPSLKSPFHHLLHSNERCSSGTSNVDKRLLFESEDDMGGDVKSGSGGHMLRHFFDDWPRSLQETDNTENNANATGGRRMNSSTCLSISMPGNNHTITTTTTISSDVSLKLSTGYGEEEEEEEASCPRNENVDQQVQLNWIGGWTSTNQVASMGGPLAEALRSSTSTSSPTSVLHQLPPRSSASETSYIST